MMETTCDNAKNGPNRHGNMLRGVGAREADGRECPTMSTFNFFRLIALPLSPRSTYANVRRTDHLRVSMQRPRGEGQPSHLPSVTFVDSNVLGSWPAL